MQTQANYYQIALDADAAFQAVLVTDYGKQAGDMRYARVLPTHIEPLRAAKIKADEEWLAYRRSLGPVIPINVAGDWI